MVLLGLITKRVYTEEDRVARAPFIYQWAQTQYKPQTSKSSLVYQSLGGEPLFYHPSDGFEITNLAMQCVEYNPKKRPSMKQVVRRLLKLHVVRYHAEILDIDRMLPNVDKLSGDYLLEKRNSLSFLFNSMSCGNLFCKIKIWMACFPLPNN